MTGGSAARIGFAFSPSSTKPPQRSSVYLMAPDLSRPNTSSYHARYSRSCGRMSGLTFPRYPLIQLLAAVSSDCVHGSILLAASARHLRGLGRPHRRGPAGSARASILRSRDRCEGVRFLRSARELPFRSHENRHCHRQKDPHPRRGVARFWPRPADRSRPPPRSIVAYATTHRLPPCGSASGGTHDPDNHSSAATWDPSLRRIAS